MKLHTITLFVITLAIFTVPTLSSDASGAPLKWFMTKPPAPRTEDPDTADIHVIGKLAYIAHELAYDSLAQTVSGETGDNFISLMDAAGIIEKENFKVSWGKIQKNPEYGLVAFRGTNNISNVLTDAKFSLIPLTTKDKKIGNGCKVHSGFFNGYKSLREDLRSAFTSFMRNNVNTSGVKNIIITGHSLGGALATLLAYDLGVYLKNEGHGFAVVPNLLLVTFGSPRVGDSCFRDTINEKIGLVANVRIVYGADAITSVPYQKEYFHVGTEYNFGSLDAYTTKSIHVDESTRKDGFTGAIMELIKNSKDHFKYKEIAKPQIIKAVNENIDALAALTKKKQRKLKKLK